MKILGLIQIGPHEEIRTPICNSCYVYDVRSAVRLRVGKIKHCAKDGSNCKDKKNRDP